MITGKTIGQLDLISPATDNLSIPVDSNGSTYRILFSGITSKINSQGFGTVTVGMNSHAEGNQTTSVGDYSHSEGQLTISNGQSSHAEGSTTVSNGLFSHSEGLSTNAMGVGSHAEGNSTQSIGYYSHSEGYETIAGWMGYNVVSVVDNVVTIDTNGEDVTPVFTSGKLLMDNRLYDYDYTEFVDPYVNIVLFDSLSFATTTPLDYSAIDKTSFDIIYSDGDDVMVPVNLPSGVTQQFLNNTYDTAYMSSNGYMTFSGGSSTCCFSIPNDIPSAVGLPGIYLDTLGIDDILYTLYTGYTYTGSCFVIRYEGTYRLNPSVTPDLIYNFLFYTTEVPYIDLVIESNPYTSGPSGVSDGVNTDFMTRFTGATGTSFRITTGTLQGFFANDLNNLFATDAPSVNGNFTHSEGFNNKALGRASHAEGGNNIAVGQYAHAEGFLTTAIGEGSNSKGLGTIAHGDYQNVMGKYNTTGNTTSLVVIGNGTEDSLRSDIVLVNTDGVEINGDLMVTGTTEVYDVNITGSLNVPNEVATFNTISVTQNGMGENIAIGDDIMMGDINVANTLGIKGVQDATQAFIQFASGCAVGSTSRGAFNISGVSEYTDNSDALSNGLLEGDVYRTGDLLKIVHS